MACAGVLLTGGTSRRLGFDKATVRVGTETVATRAARVLGAVCAPVLEVGPGYTTLRAIREQPAGSGPLAALVAGVDALRIPQVLLLACDLVRIEAPLLQLLAEWDGAPTVVPLVEGRPQFVCARYGADALATAAVLVAAGERSLRALVAALDADGAVDLVPEQRWRELATADAFADLDTPADLARLGLDRPG